MQWVAHKGWQEKGAKPNSKEALLDALETNFRVEFDLLFFEDELVVAHSKEDVTADTITLREALEILSPAPNELTLDLKNKGGEEMLLKSIEPVKEKVLVCSHYLDSLLLIKDTKRGWSLPSPGFNLLDALEVTSPEQINSFMLHYSLISSESVQEIKKHGYKVNTWTVDNKDVLFNVLNCDVDSITSNYPAKMRATVKK